jgi:hypothetical protein
MIGSMRGKDRRGTKEEKEIWEVEDEYKQKKSGRG